LKKKKRSALFTIIVNLLFIAAIAAVGWKIYDYVSVGKKTTELAKDLWEQAAITAEPTTTETMIIAATETTAKIAASESTEADAAATTAPENKQENELTNVKEEQKQTEVHSKEADSMTTPAPAEREKSHEKANSAFLNMLNSTPTPKPTPRYTDLPDIPVGIDFEKLAETNKDVAAWLYHPGMGINLPVVHGRDNEYYLKRGFNRFTSQAGTLFIDYRNKGDFSDRNTIIYGHARHDLGMFGKLHYYGKAGYCEKYPFFYLYIPGQRYQLEVVATGDTKNASDYYDLPAGYYWNELLDHLIERSPYDFGIAVSPEDHYVTLSTCAYDYEDERWIVIARIVDPDGTLPALPDET